MLTVRLLCSALSLLTAAIPAGALTLTQFNSPLTENFDSLAPSGTAATLPAGWAFVESGSAANTSYSAGAGSSTTGDTYSFGAGGSLERALGTLQSSTLTSILTLSLVNGTAGAITQLGIAYTGEQWRLGSTGRSDRLDFAFSLDGLSWLDVDALDFIAPNAGGTVGALDGNAGANRIDLSHTLSGLNIASGRTFWLRWSDFGAAGSDDGLAIDNFSISAIQTVSPTGREVVPDAWSTAWAVVPMGVLLWFRGRRAHSRAALPGTRLPYNDWAGMDRAFVPLRDRLWHRIQ